MRSEEEVEEQMMEAAIRSSEISQCPGMSYEQGVRDALSWILEETDEPPMEDFDE